MAQNTSRAGQRVDRVRVNDDPHENYTEDGRPVLTKVDGGRIIEKDVEVTTATCPECDVAAYYDEDEEPVCPQCGMLCSGDQADGVPTEQLLIDAKAAGRLPSTD